MVSRYLGLACLQVRYGWYGPEVYGLLSTLFRALCSAACEPALCSDHFCVSHRRWGCGVVTYHNRRLHGMWLDRFSGHSTPSGSPPPPQQRSYSPGPRRPTHLAPALAQRPGFSPRTSSLSIAVNSNASTTSLASTSRLTNGSALKQQITPPPDAADPLDVLEKVVGLSLHRKNAGNGLSDNDTIFNKPTSLVEVIEFDGLSLHDLAQAEADGAGDVEEQHYIVQPVEECEYVYRLVRLQGQC